MRLRPCDSANSGSCSSSRFRSWSGRNGWPVTAGRGGRPALDEAIAIFAALEAAPWLERAAAAGQAVGATTTGVVVG